MTIDCHGHYTTEPKALLDFRARQIAAVTDGTAPPAPSELEISDDDIRAGLEGAQLKLQAERGIDRTIFSPRASGMGHHIGDFALSSAWTRICNDLIARVCRLYPDRFTGVCQLPQSIGVSPESCVDELERCITELGFVGCNLNPDPSGGYFNAPPLSDPWWYPLYAKLVELDVPAMIHVSGCCNPAQHTTGSYYLNADTMAYVQLMTSDLFQKFPALRLIIPHGGGAVPYHWGRFRGIALMNGRPEPDVFMGDNLFFDTCVYHKPGLELLTSIVPIKNLVFASEMLGAVKGNDPRTGRAFDDTKWYLENIEALTATDKQTLFEANPYRIFPRLPRAAN